MPNAVYQTVGRSRQDMSQPAGLLATGAFTRVILANKARVAEGSPPRLEPEAGQVVLRFRVWCAVLAPTVISREVLSDLCQQQDCCSSFQS